MWAWILENTAVLSVGLNAAMLVVWSIYLQVIYNSYRRANRAVIHIDMGGGGGEGARCMVTNMGADTVYILGVKVELDCAQGICEALVADRLEADAPLGGDFREKTSKGPLSGGQAVDIGSFTNIIERASNQMAEGVSADTCRSVEITVVVAAQQAHRLMGGHKRFDVVQNGDRVRFTSRDLLTRQITSWSSRRRLQREIVS